MPLSPKHQRIVRLRRLLRRRTLREAERKFVLEGARAIEAAISAGSSLEAVFYEPTTHKLTESVLSRVTEIGYRVYEVAPGTLDRVGDAVTSQPIAAIAPFVDVKLHELKLTSTVVIMAGVSDPGNAGTIVRSSLAAGASAVVLCDCSVDIYNPKTVRSSAGSLFSQPLSIVDSLDEVAQFLRGQGYGIVGTSSTSNVSYWSSDLTGKTALVLGNEGSGLDDEQSSLVDFSVSIPIDPRAESLNVAVAGSLLIFEARRQLGGF